MIKQMLRSFAVRSRLLLCVALTTFAGAASATETWVTDYIKSVYPLSDGSFVIIFASSQPVCTNDPTAQYFYVSPGNNGVTADAVKAMLATSLTAYALEKKISLAFESASSYCYVNRLQITR
jgi:formylmethanofuran dehydrogenase subunit E-like metal-binding protein